MWINGSFSERIFLVFHAAGHLTKKAKAWRHLKYNLSLNIMNFQFRRLRVQASNQEEEDSALSIR